MACSTGEACGLTDTRSSGRRWLNHSSVMIETSDADEAWCPPTFSPSGLGRTRLAWCTIDVASHNTRCSTSRSVASRSMRPPSAVRGSLHHRGPASTMPCVRNRLPREVRVLVFAAFMIAIGYGVVAPALPVFARSFDVSVAAASAVVSAFAVARVLFAPVSGRLVGRVGELPVFCGGLSVVAASSAACAFAADYGQLLAFRAAGGLGSTMFTVSAASLLVRISPPAMRGRASGAWATGFLLGSIAGPVVGGGLIAGSLRAPFF